MFVFAQMCLAVDLTASLQHSALQECSVAPWEWVESVIDSTGEPFVWLVRSQFIHTLSGQSGTVPHLTACGTQLGCEVVLILQRVYPRQKHANNHHNVFAQKMGRYFSCKNALSLSHSFKSLGVIT